MHLDDRMLETHLSTPTTSQTFALIAGDCNTTDRRLTDVSHWINPARHAAPGGRPRSPANPHPEYIAFSLARYSSMQGPSRRLACLNRQLSGPHRRVSGTATVVAAVEPTPEEEAAALVGQPVEAVDTPALIVELDALEHNIATFARTLAGRNCVWRPHCKAIRSPELALKLVEAGAVGVTCAKLSQASALVDGGVRDVLIANEIVGPTKLAALVALAGRCDAVCVACDAEEQLRATSAAAARAGVTIHVLIDVNVGMNRCGVHWERHDEIVRLCQLAVELPALEHRGLMGYDGGGTSTAE
jgi:hypothetical protein